MPAVGDRFCPYCGQAREEGDRFCGLCGQELGVGPAPAIGQSPAPAPPSVKAPTATAVVPMTGSPPSRQKSAETRRLAFGWRAWSLFALAATLAIGIGAGLLISGSRSSSHKAGIGASVRAASAAATATTAAPTTTTPTSQGTSGAPDTSSLPSQGGGGTSTAASTTGTQTYSGDAYSAQYPAVMTVGERDRSHGSYSESKFVKPDHSLAVVIDRSPGVNTDPATSARNVESGVKSLPGYRPFSFNATTINGRPAFAWSFAEEGRPLPFRSVYYFNLAGDGYAVLAKGNDGPEAAAVARQVAQSVRTLGG